MQLPTQEAKKPTDPAPVIECQWGGRNGLTNQNPWPGGMCHPLPQHADEEAPLNASG
jgi:hypothetical protein